MNKVITYSFCQDFIEQVANYIQKEYIEKDKDLTRLAIVFGGKRPSLFLKRELANRIGQSFFSPQFITIDHLVDKVIRQHEQFVTNVDLDSSYFIYQIVCKHTPHLLKGREAFSEFLPWAKEILKFIDQIDLEGVSDKALTNIEEIAKIGFSIPQEINHLLENIVIIRQKYHEQQNERQIYSRGYRYRRAAELIDQTQLDEYDQCLFCNFFYFNHSEEKIINSIYRQGKATFIFQGDQRRWPILDRLAKKHEWEIMEGPAVDQTNFDLNLYAGFDGHSQIGVVRKILEQIDDPQNTVVVLPNADQIVPLLSEISSIVREFNISMGYPLKRSSLYTLFELIFKAQLSRKGTQYYARDFLKVILHPFSKNLKVSGDESLTRIIMHKIEEILKGKEQADLSGSLFFDLNELEAVDELYEIVSEIYKVDGQKMAKDQIKDDLKYLNTILFRQWEGLEDFKQFSDNAEYFLSEFIDKSLLKNFPLNLNIAHKIFQILDEFRNSDFSHEKFPQDEIFKVFDQKMLSEIVSFIGSPLKGLQLLGLFETRSLNFKNVIVLDVNEGVLPKLDIYEPLIPRDVMINLGLNRIELDEEIQRYQFMRLISSATNVHLVYQQNKEKEKSRFVEELIWEKERQNQSLGEVSVYRPTYNVVSNLKTHSVKKTPEMLEMLKAHSYSASSINTYLRNPMDFYEQYVLGLREQEDLLEEPEARHIGTFIHAFLEDIYRPYINQAPNIDKEFIEMFNEQFDNKFDQSFKRSMRSDSFLLRSVVKERLNRFVLNEKEAKDRQIKKILHLESRFEGDIQLSCGSVRFNYIIDRIDEMADGTIMVIDYKTGSFNPMPKKLDVIEHMELTRESIFENIQSFQIPLYFNFLHKEYQKKKVNAGLYNLRTLKVDRFITDKTSHTYAQINSMFQRALDYMMSDILNPEIEFINDPLV